MFSNRLSVAMCLAAALLCGCAEVKKSPTVLPRMAQTATVEARVEKLLAQMTLEEKIDYIGGDKRFYIRSIPRLGIPEIMMADGPVGIRNYGPSTAYPAGVALAATWDTELAHQFGASMARDGRARGVHILLAPGVNICRSPLCGRNFEYCGEDPFLAATVSTAIIKGVQDGGVLATVKHFAANNQEYARREVSSDLDERTLHEIYLPTFESAVKEGEVACVMNAYNLLNGVHCSQNNTLNNQILKKDWGFDGILMSDWNSTYDGVAAANAGLDLEMPSGKFMNRETLLPAVQTGQVSVATIDDKVRRILRVIIRAGFLDREQLDASIPKDDPQSAKTALRIAHEGIVLLRNQAGVLPLNANGLKSIAVIGPNGDRTPAGGGSSLVEPFHSVSALEGIRRRAGDNVRVSFESGSIFPDIGTAANESRFVHLGPDGKPAPGLKAEYFKEIKLEGDPVLTRIDQTINFDWNKSGPEGMPQENFSVRWTGEIRPEADGDYLFMSCSDDGIRVWLDGKRIVNDWADHGPLQKKHIIPLLAGKAYDLRIEYYQHTMGALAQFSCTRLTDEKQTAAVEAARNADVAVVCVGFDDQLEFEGGDRTFQMPGEQDRLIERVLEANPNTVVIVNSGGAVDMSRWADKVPGVLQAWYLGQENGTALADVLFGDVNPSGKLPTTFERHDTDNPSFPYYPAADGKTTRFEEGIFVGYRGFDAKKIDPLFCFGHGLSYTTFQYSDLDVRSDGEGASVSFRVKNSGPRAGDEIAQVYVASRESSVPRAPKELKGFSRVGLQPGESRTVTVKLGRRAFSFFDVASHDWKTEAGKYEVLVGASSRDIRGSKTVTIR